MLKKIIFCTSLLTSMIASAQKAGPFNFTVVKNIEATDVKSQDQTGTCWSFSTSSFIEAEIFRKTGVKTDLSEMFVVRKVYLDKAINYLRFHGMANFSQGALAHDLFRIFETYGAMPEEVYSGKKKGEKHNHGAMEKELKTYLDSLLSKKTIEPHWKEGFEKILDKHLGVLPAVFEVDKIKYNAKSYAESLNINVNNYVGFTSFTHHPFYGSFAIEVPDNFSRGFYTNVDMFQLIELMVSSINQGYTVEWDGDVSETGFGRQAGVAVLLAPGEQIGDSLPVEIKPTQELRQAAFDSHETTDDHLMHITGMATDQKGNRYFIVKNSWGNKAGINGYVYMSENYMAMKTISIMIHRTTIPPLIRHLLSHP